MFSVGERAKALHLEDYLGQGAFGSVFRATHQLLKRTCAVKFVPNENPQVFKEHLEGQVLERCRHDNVVQVYDVDIHQKEGILYAGIEMELMEFGSIESSMQSNFWSIRDTIKAMIDVLFALEHAHANGILHRDVKPANIMLSRHGAKLSDFGIAASLDVSNTASANGTPVFSAPEVFSKNVTDPRTEVFSVGMSLFQAFNNITDWSQLPLDEKVVLEGSLIRRAGYQQFVPRRARAICNKACDPDPDRRYQSAREMRQALESLHVLIDWRPAAGANHWRGHANDGKVHDLSIADLRDNYVLEYRKNGRRSRAECEAFETQPQAEEVMLRRIYNSTF